MNFSWGSHYVAPIMERICGKLQKCKITPTLTVGGFLCVRPLNTTEKFSKSYRNCEHSHQTTKQSSHSIWLNAASTFIWLKHGTRTFVVKTRSLEETNHVAGVCHGGGIVTAVKAQGSQLCHFLSLAVGERRGRVFVRLPPCEGEKPPPGFSLVQHVLLERATCF